MKIIVHKLRVFIVLFFLFAISGNVIGQTYTITGNVNASTLSCGTFTGYDVITIGNGTTTPSNLIMNGDLDLTSCSLGPIQVIVNNATLDFSGANKRLYLPAGSSIIFINGGTLNPDGSSSGGGCTGNDRIYIGGVLLASCNGGSGLIGFDDLVTFGGSGGAISNSPICVGNSVNLYASPPPNGSPFTYTWFEPSVSPTVPIGTGQNISIASPTSGSHIYQVNMYSTTLTGTMIAQTTVVVNSGASTATPTVTLTQPTCTLATGTITITAPTGLGMRYSINGLTYTNSTGIFPTLAAGTYSVTAKNSSGCISNATTVIINSATKTWNGSWVPSAPTITDNIVFAGVGTFSSTGDLSGCSCLVTSGTVNINAGHTLTLTNGLTVSGGTMFFKDDSSLVQTNNFANSGNITYERSIAPSIRDTDYTYWSSPVAGFTVGGVSPTTFLFYSYNSSVDNWQSEASTTVMTAGKGYIIRGPEPFSGSGPPPPPAVSPFIGVPNNGNYSITGIVADRSYLIGNPYPSALDADAFLLANNTVIEGTIYFWTHNTEMGIGVSNPGTGAFAYSQDDYASYNTTGGVGTGNTIAGATPSDPRIEVTANRPNGYIAAGQGFFATSLVSPSPTTITYTNLMRETGNNTQFFRTSNIKTKGSIVKNRVWLNLTNMQGAFKQTLVGYISGATNEYDNAFDGESFDGNEFVDFYSVNQDKNLVIQGRALPFDENDQVELGFRTTINGAFTIKIDQVDGLLTNQAVFIEDKLTNTVFDLKNGNYTFNTVAGTFNDRFVLRYTNKTLSTIEIDTLENQVLVSNKNKQIKINSLVELMDKVLVYDLLGRPFYQKDKINNTELSLPNLGSNQTLLLKITLQNGQTVTKKILH
ncbi:T9SS sorting signal type C domain-containing protein [Flavobacterium sp.]|uniref:T9SS sorting signal type C domain-containing protein n=1 Tax=Flavobacterium sp. TaxID=239 RepID=UPI00286BD23F|nr:T9SS sorting signal type C domain-containing protein [Flavobacterium sp.]